MIYMAVAPLIFSSAKLTMLISTLKDRYNNPPTTLIATLTGCKIMNITLSKIQGLVYKNEAGLSSRLKAQELMREAFDCSLTGCRMTLAALDLELDKLMEPRKVMEKGTEETKIGFQMKQKDFWKETAMKQLLDQTRGQILSLQCLIQLLESETQEGISQLLKENTADIQRVSHRARSIRSEQGIEDDKSSFQLAHQASGYGLVPSYEAELSRSSTYKRAQMTAAEELLARKIELLDEKYALEEKLEGLLLVVDSKDEKITRQEHEILSRNEKIGRLEHDILLKDRRLLLKEKKISELENKISQRDEGKDLKEDSIVHDWVASYARAVGQLLKVAASIEAAFGEGYTPLHEAVRQGDAGVLKVLLKRGATKEATRKNGWTALYLAASNGEVKQVKSLLEKGAKEWAAINIGWTPLYMAARNGHVEVAQVLLENGALLEASRKDQWTPLHAAIHFGHVEVVQMLLEKGANTEAQSSNGLTPLHGAAVSGQVKIVKLLLEKEANKDAECHEGTPLNLAAGKGHVEVVKILLEKGVNTEAKNMLGRTPLDTAKDFGHFEVVKILGSKRKPQVK